METKPKKEDVVYFGRTDFRNQARLFGIKRKDRRQHMYIIGKTGVGKSSLMSNLIIQDIANGEGICVIDPHGELAESILRRIPEERADDVIYFNPADADYHIGFNVLELPDPKYKHLAASGLMAIFTKMWSNVWSARMEYILNNAILALLDTPGASLLGVNRIMVDKDYRQEIINNVKDPVVRAFWVHEYEEWRDQFRNEAIAPIQNKVGQFLSTALVRNIVGQTRSTINIFDIMNESKILIINVSKGTIGEDNSALLGGMLITKIQLAAMERVRIPEDERVDFYLYVDEFQNFATDSFASVLSEARKYRLNLILAHQYIGQLVTDVSTKVRDAIFGNTGTMITFRVGAVDAEFLEQEFQPEFMAEDLVNLPNYCVYLKLMVDGMTSRPFSATTLPEFQVAARPDTRDRIIENSRRKYAVPRHIVEAEIENWSASTAGRAASKIEAICHACGEKTDLKFQPKDGRAIYCPNCLKKIRDGTLKPVLDSSDFSTKPRTQYFANMTQLGIEIEEEPKVKVSSKTDEGDERQNYRPVGQPNPFQPRTALRRVTQKYTDKFTAESAVRPPDNETEIRLKDLKPKEHSRPSIPKQKSKPDIERLRSALKDTLTKGSAPESYLDGPGLGI